MPDVVLSLGPYRFEARFESSAAPRTCAAVRGLLASGLEHLREMGERVLWQGAQPLRIEAA